MVLLVHGGPWARDGYGYNSLHQWLANRGYAVLSVNLRGSTGFGKAFLNAGDQEWAKKMHDDLLDAVGWATTQKIADPAKVAIMGGSYGGYATLVGLTYTPKVFATAKLFLSKHLGGRFQPIENDFEGSSIQIKAGMEQLPELQKPYCALEGRCPK